MSAIETEILSLSEIETLAYDALLAVGTTAQNARPLAIATAATEAEGIASHGLAYIPVYCEHVTCGKVDGAAVPLLTRPRPGVIVADAATGFAHSAIAAGFAELMPLARSQGIAALAVRNSYNCGVLGYHTRQLAAEGLLGLGFTNAPASIAPVGGTGKVVGTNPFSIAAPDGKGGIALLIDQSASVIAKSEIMKHNREGKPIPEGWGLGPDGQPTTDAAVALQGSMAPSGGYKGVGVALLVEVMAAAMTGASLGVDASPFSGTAGGPPKTGQFFIAIDPEVTSSGDFAARIQALVGEMHAQDGVRTPGDARSAARKRAEAEGVAVNAATLAKIRALL
ncbi:Ldh family oxidoreductase [Pararhodobacter oceanensis]|uniref:Sulfolactate dehydrogenase n=1 Tax=Pararhodobacter oceanensis TaxID=2172121 RepID=A0A2T8HSP3_9RHOB|nr:Ldh family oxidoreductase [Pararhodobacter oceanensis]PVH28470.1 sulfolactate dehydrogenase [Pararhodobacter oceanensis]